MNELCSKAVTHFIFIYLALTASVAASDDDVNPDALLDLLSEHRNRLERPFVDNDVLCHCTDYGCDDELYKILGSAGRGMCRAEGGVCKKTVSLVVMKDGEPPRLKTDLECVRPKYLQPPGRPFTCHANKKQRDRINIHCCRSTHFCNDNTTAAFVCTWHSFARAFRAIKRKITSIKEKRAHVEKTGIVKLEDGVIADPSELEKLDNKEFSPAFDMSNSFPFMSADFDSKLSGTSLADAFFDLQQDLERKFANKSEVTAELEAQIALAAGPDHAPNHLLKLLDDLDSAPSTYSPSDTSGGISCKSTGVPVNLQRSFAQQIEVKRDMLLGGGRFGRVYKGYWRGDFFAVKTMDTKDHFSWARETEIYNTNMLRHNNLLRFIASYTHDAGYYMENWIITEFHEMGDLSDYLLVNSVSRNVGLRMMRGLASGLSYLHHPIIGHRAEGKPAIAHRDLKSKNVLVKNDLTVCIADLGLSVKYDAMNNCIDGDTQRKCGTPRYLSPELLDDSINLGNFDAFCLSDIYALSLIFWEILHRMDDSRSPPRYSTTEYELPYYEHVSREPTQDDLRMIVCDKQLRPQFQSAWTADPTMVPLLSIITDMWSPRPVNRPTAERVRIKVDSVIDIEENARALREYVIENSQSQEVRHLLSKDNLTC
uniref:receptor protein serine/threonine kinase n=1 Tax=Steinernema glaseri TaxID=37863 RepID=A0A1I7Y2U2_9BILA